MFSGVLIADKVDGVGDHGWGGTTIVHVQTLLEAFLNISLRSVHFIKEVFLWQKVLGLLSSSAESSGFPNYQEFCCVYFQVCFSCMNFRLTFNLLMPNNL